MSQIMWKELGKYNKIKCLMGGFHILLVWLKVLNKQFGALGFRDWWCQANIIAEGSADQAAEGRHYSRSMHLHKQSLEALLRFKASQVNISQTLHKELKALKSEPSALSLERVTSCPDFNSTKAVMLQNSGTMGRLVGKYVKDVSAMLSFVASLRDRNMELHLQALQHFIPLLFAFNHPNYSRYLTYSHILLSKLKTDDPDAYDDLFLYGPGVSLSGDEFSSIPGDFVTEIGPNRESKIRGGPMRGGDSTSPEAVDRFYKNSHKLAKLRKHVKDHLHIKTSSAHNETSARAKAKHEKQAVSLIEKLQTYYTPFEGLARNISTGIELEPAIVEGLIGARSVGEEMHRMFYTDRLLSSEVDFYAPIKRSTINTGLDKKEKAAKALSVLKEDRQALGIIMAKCHDNREAFSHCLTKYPLSISTPDGKLYQPGSKSKFRNHLIEQAEAVMESPPCQATCIYDGMALIRASNPAATLGQYMSYQLKAFTPPAAWYAKETVVVFDNYIEDQEYSIKEAERLERGCSPRVHLGSNDQQMMGSKDFQWFMHNKENKDELIKRFNDFVEHPEVRNHLKVPLTINHRSITKKITRDDIDVIVECNHEEADTRVVLHAFNSEGSVIVKAKDMDILILMIYAYALKKPEAIWCMQIDHNKFVNVGKIAQFLNESTCLQLPAFHSLTGCDTTSYFYRISKPSVFEKARKNQSLYLLEQLGNERTLGEDGEASITKFIHETIYNGKRGDDLVTTRIRQYDKLRVKTTQSIIPDPESIRHLIQRANMAAYYMKAFSSPVIEKIDPCESGWLREENGCLIPFWYRGPQMPASIRAVRRRGERRYEELQEMNRQGIDPDFSDDENGQEMLAEEGNDLVGEEYASSEQDFWENFDSESDGYDSNDAEYLP